jgi:Ca-activated chloride channel homolog
VTKGQHLTPLARPEGSVLSRPRRRIRREARSLRPAYPVLLAVLILVAGAGMAAQTGQSNKESTSTRKAAGAPQLTIKVPVNLVNVLFTVTNKKGRLVPNLPEDDFRVYEDGIPQKVSGFGRAESLPLRIAVLVDTSNSIRLRLPFEKEAAIDFLNAVVRPGTDEAFVVSFDVEPELLQDYTDNVDRLSSAIGSLQAGGGTGLFDALYYACQQKMLHFPPNPPYLRRVVVLVSDGVDNESQHSEDEALAMAQRVEAVIFCVSTNRSGIETRGDKILRYFSTQTGGQAFAPLQASDLASAYQRIARELRTQYALAYYSTNRSHNNAFRRIRIAAIGKGLRVHAKSGYFPASE